MGLETQNTAPDLKPEIPSITTTNDYAQGKASDRSIRLIIIGVVAFLIVFVLLLFGVYVLAQPTTDTARVRDIVIIIMALESLLLGAVLIILIIQIARLTNLLQNEIKPILESTNETVSTLRGTTAFLSENLVQPVIKMNEYLAALQQFLIVIGLSRRRK
jgi:hypothetical protein